MRSRDWSWLVPGRTGSFGLALVALALLGLTVPLAGRSLEQAETDARERAVQTTADVLVGAVPPELASNDIVGTERRDLMELVHEEILDDDRMARILIWTPQGDPIFSSAPPDDTTSDDLPFSQAAGGVPAAAVVDGIGTTLHRTFVPLKPIGVAETYAVAQIDQRYDAIEAEANRGVRTAQVVLLLVLGVALVAIVLSFGRPRAQRAEREVSSEQEDERIRGLEERARASEESAREAQERLATAERRMSDASVLEIPPKVLAQVEELEAQVRQQTGERERSQDELRLLRETLQAKEDAFARSAERVADADRRAEEADRRAGEEQARAADSEARAVQAEARLVQAEQQATDLVASVAATDARVAELETALRDAEESNAQGASEAERARGELEERAAQDLRAAQLEAEALREKLAEVEAASSSSSYSAPVEPVLARLTLVPPVEPAPAVAVDPAPAPPEGAPATMEMTLLRDERDVARADLMRARRELDEARSRLAELVGNRLHELS
jgi:hypothetical protein